MVKSLYLFDSAVLYSDFLVNQGKLAIFKQFTE